MSAEDFFDQVARTLAPEHGVARSRVEASGAPGADGTPMAVLVSTDRLIASSVVGGGPVVLDLLQAGELVTGS